MIFFSYPFQLTFQHIFGVFFNFLPFYFYISNVQKGLNNLTTNTYIPITLTLFFSSCLFTSIRLSIFLPIHQSLLFLMHFKVSCSHQYTSP